MTRYPVPCILNPEPKPLAPGFYEFALSLAPSAQRQPLRSEMAIDSEGKIAVLMTGRTASFGVPVKQNYISKPAKGG